MKLTSEDLGIVLLKCEKKVTESYLYLVVVHVIAVSEWVDTQSPQRASKICSSSTLFTPTVCNGTLGQYTAEQLLLPFSLTGQGGC